jgi:hypothetical protein
MGLAFTRRMRNSVVRGAAVKVINRALGGARLSTFRTWSRVGLGKRRAFIRSRKMSTRVLAMCGVVCGLLFASCADRGQDAKPSEPVTVHLPDGTQFLAEDGGDIRLPSGKQFHLVLEQVAINGDGCLGAGGVLGGLQSALRVDASAGLLRYADVLHLAAEWVHVDLSERAGEEDVYVSIRGVLRVPAKESIQSSKIKWIALFPPE